MKKKRKLTAREEAFIPYCKMLQKEYAGMGMEDLFDDKTAWEDFNNMRDEEEAEEAFDEADFDEDGAIYVEYDLNDIR